MKPKFTLILFVCVISIGHSNVTTAQVDMQDSLALVDLYNSTDGSHWNNHENWLTSKPVKSWMGIQLSLENKVAKIELYENNLNGSLPSSLGNLTHLDYLWLDNNQLSGSIPKEIGNLTNLQYLRLQNNQLSGGIPPSFGNLINLVFLELGHNQLSGPIPSELGNTSVRDLGLAYNQLNGQIPSSLGKLDLLSLYLDHNRLSGHIPEELGNPVYLNSLNLSDNKLSDTIPSS